MGLGAHIGEINGGIGLAKGVLGSWLSFSQQTNTTCVMQRGIEMEAREVFADSTDDGTATPIWLVSEGRGADIVKDIQGELSKAQTHWIAASTFCGKAGSHLIVPAEDGSVACVLLGTGKGAFHEPCGSVELNIGRLPRVLPKGVYRIGSKLRKSELAAVAWGLGAYQFARYKSKSSVRDVKLVVKRKADRAAALNEVASVWMARDLINTPASDLGPDELETAARKLGDAYGAKVTSVCGDELIDQNFPMIHAVGRASSRQPRLIELNWSPGNNDQDLMNVTLVGKGICFDTGGLNLKLGAGMLLMKKDMGGAATVLALGQMIMAAKLKVRLRVLIAAAENSVSGNAFRPSDILMARNGKSVEIGNTDAEGRLVLADALSYADEDSPDLLISMATLTGSARVALGPDLPAFFSNDDAFAERVAKYGGEIGDPIWQMPFWEGYDGKLESNVADMKNVSDGPFAGAITAALFLKRFVAQAKCFAHVDLYGWSSKTRALGPKGGEPMTARAIFRVLQERVSV